MQMSITLFIWLSDRGILMQMSSSLFILHYLFGYKMEVY